MTKQRASILKAIDKASKRSQGFPRSVMAWLNSPGFLTRFHGTATVVWMFLAIPSFLWWKDSLMWIIGMSLWANVASHWAAYQASRAERRMDSDDSDS